MKKLLLTLLSVQLAWAGYAQEGIYTTTGGEMIFQMSEVNEGGPISTNTRWTIFLHLGTYVHKDFNNNFGLFSGLSLRNVGFITNEDTEKKIRRTYNLGLPLAIKVGVFDKHLFLFGGAEYEWLFHYKEKYWPNSNGKRDGEKVKYTEWFSNRVNRFVPSVFVGVETPWGMNIRFKYYLQNYMNQNYIDASGDLLYSDLEVNLYYISIGWNMDTKDFKKKFADW